MDKLTTSHLSRSACVYVRQSTLKQVNHNKESQRLQYGLINKAKSLGWENINLIDDDLGVSGSGQARRVGFEKLLANVCEGKVGAIFAMDASRLARNGREWHTLLEFCGLVHTLIVDLECIYDPRLHNDRLLLGMKGTLSEMETSLFKQRAQAAMRQKASRGEYHTSVAIGYLANGKYLEKDPNQQIQQAIQLVFDMFKKFQSVRQALLWFRQEKINLPCQKFYDGRRYIEWRLPVYNTILGILKKPVYAGCYVYGRTKSKTLLVDGHKKIIRGIKVDLENWSICIQNHHESYITWKQYKENQKIIMDNANMKGAMVRGSVRKGRLLLMGLLRCRRCGRKLLVHYSGKSGRYQCKGALQNHGEKKCIGFGGLRVDHAVSNMIQNIISPIGIKASLLAANELAQKKDDIRQHHELALKQANYEAERIERQYKHVEPENRLVAAELEKRWEQALKKVNEKQKYLDELPQQNTFSDVDKQSLIKMGAELSDLWSHDKISFENKKHIIRILIKEIIVDITDNEVILIIHWQGGTHTRLTAKKNKTGQHRYTTDTDISELIEKLSRYLKDDDLAALLNRLGKKTGKGHSWNKSRVCAFRNTHSIPVYKKNEHHKRGELTVAEACSILNVPDYTLRRLIKNKLLPAQQICTGAPWIIEKKDAELFVKKYGKNKRKTK